MVLCLYCLLRVCQSSLSDCKACLYWRLRVLSKENYSIRIEVGNLASFSLVLLEEGILRFSFSESGWVFCVPFTSNLLIPLLIYRSTHKNHPQSCTSAIKHPTLPLALTIRKTSPTPQENIIQIPSHAPVYKNRMRCHEVGFAVKPCSNLSLLCAGWRPPISSSIKQR